MNDRLCSIVGFSMKAGKCKSGEFAVEKSLKGKSAKLLIIDSEASELSNKRWRNAAFAKTVPIITMSELGRAIGRDGRMIAAITDDNFAAAILKEHNQAETQYRTE